MDPEPSEKDGDTSDWFERLYEHFAPMRQEAIERGYTEDEINGWIDERRAMLDETDELTRDNPTK